MRLPSIWFFCLILAVPVAARAGGDHSDTMDLKVVQRLKTEASRGQVMDHLFWLTDANGPRLTNSPGFRSAADWAVRTLKSWGAQNPHLERWGTFGRGWALNRLSINLVQPVYAPLHGIAKAWSAGTRGKVTAELIYAPFNRGGENDWLSIARTLEHNKRYMDEYRGKLHGKIVLMSRLREWEPSKEPAVRRYDDAKLTELGTTPENALPVPYEWPMMELPASDKERQALFNQLPTEVMWEYFDRLSQTRDALSDFFRAEGAVAVFTTDERGEGGVLFSENSGHWQQKGKESIPTVVIVPEQYNRLARLLQRKTRPQVELDVDTRFIDDAPDGVNVIAEIPGRKRKDEIVMLGGHLDSWHSGTGATDNGAGSAVVLEAFRLLKTLGLPMDRTVRLALWSGEEQGLYGSRGYVAQHFGDPVTMQLRPEHAKLAGYFNLDNGSGKIRGIYLQGNEVVRPIFDAWLAPFRDEGATTISPRNTGGTDHLSFDAVGLPGFQFIQDPLDYESRTHHSELDVYEHANPSDLMQASAIMAAFVYAAANRTEMLPRKPLPPPLPPKRKL
jgi:hypothetical protein